MARRSSSHAHAPGSGRATIRRLVKPPYHVVRLGPIDTDEGPASMYVAIAGDELMEPIVAEDDAAGLAGVMAAAGTGPRTCDEVLVEAGAALGFRVGETPAWAVPAIAAIAARLHNAFTVGAEVAAAAWDDLLDALAGFVWNAPWEMWGDGDRIVVELAIDGAAAQRFDATVLGSTGETFGLALYPGPGGVERAEAAIDSGDLAQLQRVPSVVVTLDREPAWVAAAVDAAFGTAAAPHLRTQDTDGQRPATAADLHALAAAMCAIAALSPWVPEVTLTRAVPDAPTVRATARLAPQP